MGNYRPKSLDELNSMHGLSVEADNAIKKGTSKLDTVKAPAVDGFSEDKTPEVGKATPEQVAADEIASKVGDFAKTFGSAAQSKAPVSIATVQSRPRVPKKKPEAPVADAEKGGKRVYAPKDSKAKLIRNSERTSLFEHYKSVMNDEDDFPFDADEDRKVSSRKKKADKKSKSSAAPVDAEEGVASAQAQAAVDAVFVPGNAGDEADSGFQGEAVATPFEKAEEQLVHSCNSEGNSVLRIVLTAVLLFVLMLSVAIGGIKAFTGINTDAVTFGGKQLYSAETDYTGTNIKKNSLVIVENKQPGKGDTIAYRESSGKYGFAAFGDVLNSESMIVDGSNDKSLVFINEYRGAVVKTVPVIGSIFAVCSEKFAPVMALMFLIIGLLVLLIFYTSKNDGGKPDYVEEEQVQQDIPEYSAQEAESDAQTAGNAEPDVFDAFVDGSLGSTDGYMYSVPVEETYAADEQAYATEDETSAPTEETPYEAPVNSDYMYVLPDDIE